MSDEGQFGRGHDLGEAEGGQHAFPDVAGRAVTTPAAPLASKETR